MTTLYIQPKDTPHFENLDKVRNHFKSQGIEKVDFQKPKFHSEPRLVKVKSKTTTESIIIESMVKAMFNLFKK